MKGACNCGAVQFDIGVEPTGIFVCHCSICRRHTGTNGNAVLVVGNDDFHWTAGEDCIATWRKPGHDWQIWFCRLCGAQVPGHNSPSTMFVPAGSLTDGADDLEVLHHIWVDSKAAWDVIGDSGQQHRKAFEGEP